MNSTDQSSDNDPCRALWGSWLGGIPGQHGTWEFFHAISASNKRRGQVQRAEH